MQNSEFHNVKSIAKIDYHKCGSASVCEHSVKFIGSKSKIICEFWDAGKIWRFYKSRGIQPPDHFLNYHDKNF